MATFRAMNTDVAVITDAAHDARVTAAVERVFADAEQRFSRFRNDSELARLNRATEPMVVSRPMFDALVAARRYVEMTDGVFDPAIGGTLVALGYDRSFAPGALDRDSATLRVAARPGAFDRDTDVAPPRAGRFLDVRLDPVRRTVTRPIELVLDLGGMIKGRTVDRASALLPDRGAIDAGGDAVLRGAGGWLVDIEDPRDPARTIATARVRNGAVATSAANRRRWRVANANRHHLVDPRTQRSATTDLLQATIFAPTAELADVLAKTVFVLGARAGEAFVDRIGIGAVLVRASGTPIVCGAVEVVR